MSLILRQHGTLRLNTKQASVEVTDRARLVPISIEVAA